MIVMKFGGTSMNEAPRIRAAADLIQSQQQKLQKPLIIVASAMSQVTNQLIQAMEQAHQGDAAYLNRLETIRGRHLQTANDLLAKSDQLGELEEELLRLLAELENTYRGVFALQELTPRSHDKIVSQGERLSIRLLAAELNQRGIQAQAVDASDCIVTDDSATSARPLAKLTRKKTQSTLNPLLKDNVIPVITGFMGATEEGVTTTLGRGGSDYTATILGQALDAEAVWIWTDVDGILTADPRVVTKARPLDRISYNEAAELAYFGAKVIHPQTIHPVVEREVPVFIKNSFNPDHPGTEISAKGQTEHEITGITTFSKLNLFTIQGLGINSNPGLIARTYAALAQAEVNVLVTIQSSSRNNISFVIQQNETRQAKAQIQETFSQEIADGKVQPIVEKKVGILAVVGDNMVGTPGVAAKVFQSLAAEKINILAIAQGSVENNITVVLHEPDIQRGLKTVHDAFHL